MAVYFEPRSYQSSHWSDFIPQALGQLAGGVIGQMFDRDKQAREFNYSQRLAAGEAAAKQTEEERKRGYLQNMNFDRGDEAAFIRDAGAMSLLTGDKYSDVYNAMKMQFNNFNRGDRITAGFANPITGAENYTDYNIGLSPDIGRRAQADEAAANIDAEARKYAAGVNAGAQKYGADSRVKAAEIAAETKTRQEQKPQKMDEFNKLRLQNLYNAKNSLLRGGLFTEQSQTELKNIDQQIKALESSQSAMLDPDEVAREVYGEDFAPFTPQQPKLPWQPNTDKEAHQEFSGAPSGMELSQDEYEAMKSQFSDEQILAAGYALPKRPLKFGNWRYF